MRSSPEAGVTREVSLIIGDIVGDPACPRWLQDFATFVLGYLEDPVAVGPLNEVAADHQRDPTVRHAALWALGDLRLRDDQVIDTCLWLSGDQAAPPEVRRAAVYPLAVLWPAPEVALGRRKPHRYEEQRAVLGYIAHTEKDLLTARIAAWGLEIWHRQLARANPEDPQRVELWELEHIPPRPADVLCTAGPALRPRER